MPENYGVFFHFGGAYYGPTDYERAYFELFVASSHALYYRINFNVTTGWYHVVIS